MNEFEATETSDVMTAPASECLARAEEEIEITLPPLLAEADGVKAVYPDFDPEAALSHPVLGPLLRGETAPTLRQLYEAVYLEDILQERIEQGVEAGIASAVEAAVSQAVQDCEERLLGHIRARGQRPAENGISAASGIRMHPAVDRLTRRERALLAKRAENGETIQL